MKSRFYAPSEFSGASHFTMLQPRPGLDFLPNPFPCQILPDAFRTPKSFPTSGFVCVKSFPTLFPTPKSFPTKAPSGFGGETLKELTIEISMWNLDSKLLQGFLGKLLCEGRKDIAVLPLSPPAPTVSGWSASVAFEARWSASVCV